MAGSKVKKKRDEDGHLIFAVAVDMVVLTIDNGELQVVLIERGVEPYTGESALPGGFVQEDESLDDAAARELREETKVVPSSPLEQLRAYGAPDRDPRQRVVSVAYLAIVREVGQIEGGSDAKRAMLVPVRDVLGRRPKRELAFDHKDILRDAVEQASEKLETTSLATSFVPDEFTMSELRSVYEATWGTQLDPANFRRQVLARDFVRPTGELSEPGAEGGKPAETYRARRTDRLKSPMTRPRRRSER